MTCELNGLKVVFCDKKECVLRPLCGRNYKVRWTVLTRPGNGSNDFGLEMLNCETNLENHDYRKKSTVWT
jgi:hypothetical protein